MAEDLTTTTADSSSWAQARQNSHQLVLQAALEDLESKAAQWEQELLTAQGTVEHQRQQVAALEKDKRTLESTVEQLSTQVAQLKSSVQAKSSQVQGLEEAQTQNIERMDRLQSEGDNLRQEISRLTKVNTEYREKLIQMETLAKLGDSEVVPLKFQVDRLTTELDTLSSHNTWLDGQLRSQTEQLLEVRTSHASEMAALRLEHLESTQAHQEATAHISTLQNQVQNLESQNERLSKDLREAKISAADQKAGAEEELQLTRSLVAMQKSQLVLLQSKHDSLASQTEALKHHASEAELQSSHGFMIRQQELERKSKQILQGQAEAFEEQVQDLQQKLNDANRRLRDAEDKLLLTNTPSSRGNYFTSLLPGTGSTSSTPSRRSLAIRAQGEATSTSANDDEPLNLTDLYARLAETEDALAGETLRRKKTEILLERIKADIEATAPSFIRQRHEFEEALERQEEYKKRLDAALDEARAAREETHEYRTELGRLQARNKDLEAETTELAKQVQTLLVSRSNAGNFGLAGGSSNTSPEPTAAVIQMQSTNQKLAAQVRKMAGTIKELEEKLKEDQLRNQLEIYENDLVSLKEERKRQEVMVESIVQQRDLYRALLAKQDSHLLGSPAEEASALQMVKKHSERSKVLEQEKNKLEMDFAKVHAELSAVDKDKEAASERLARYEALNEELTKTVDRLQGEVSQAKGDVARGAAEVQFYRDKTARLEESCERSRNEASRVAASKSDLHRINAELQDSLSKAKAETSRYESELQHAKMRLRLTESQAEQAKSAEQRISQESDHLRSEISRRDALIDSIQRIEATLSAKAASEVESFKSQIASLTEKLSTTDSNHSLQIETLNGKVTDQEVVIKDLEQRREQAAKDALEAKKETLEATTKLQIASKKVTLLEAQLRAAKKKLGETGDVQDVEDELRTKVASLTEELESARKQCATLETRAATYEKLAKENEAALAEQTRASATANQAHGEEIAALQSQVDGAATESAKTREIIAELTNDLSAQRGDRAKELEDVNKRISELEGHAEKYKKDAESALSRYAQLESEVLVLRIDVVNAQNNYERELSLHSLARTELRAAKEEAEAESRLRKAAEEQAAAVKSKLEEGRSFLEQEKASMEKTVREYEKNLEETRAQNTLLHGQLEKIGDQIEKIQSSKGDSLDSSTTEGSADEVVTLQKTISELREVVKFLRADKDMIQVQLDSARRAAERERAAANVAKRSLEEARAELKVLQESAGHGDSESDQDILKEKLKSAEQQAKLLSESNSHLREEMEKLATSLASVKKELESSKSSSIPAEKRLKEMETEKAGLLAEKESLLREIDDWKGRVQSLVSRFNQVDPAEHAALVKKVESLEAQIKIIEAQKKAAEDESQRIRALASRASKEMMQKKAMVDAHAKTILTLTAEKESLEKAQRDGISKKELAEAKEKLTKLETEKANETIQLSGEQEINKNLRERLRQFQKMMTDMKKKESVLEKNLTDARDELEKLKLQVATAASGPGENSKTSAAHAKTPSTTNASEKESAVSEIPPPALAKEAFKEPSQDSFAAKTSMPMVPPGGFKFAPSAPKESKLSAMTDAPGPKLNSNDSPMPASTGETANPAIPPTRPSNKRPAEVAEESAESKKERTPEEVNEASRTIGEQVVVESQESETTTETVTPTPQRRASGETMELSMKEKLMEKKRKLMLVMQKKKEQMEKEQTEKEQVAKEEPVAKKTKIEEAVVHETSLSKEPSQVSGPDEKEKIHTEKGQIELATDAGESSKGNTWGMTSAPVSSALNPLASAFSPHAPVASPSVFGSSIGGFGQSSEASGFGQILGQSAMGTFGSGFGSTSMGGSFFGSRPVTGDSTSTGFGGGSAFLSNIMPPGSSTSAPSFTFGSSSNITLPTPANPSPQATMFNAFSPQHNQAAAIAAKPLFGDSKKEGENVEQTEEVEEAEEGEMEETLQPEQPDASS